MQLAMERDGFASNVLTGGRRFQTWNLLDHYDRQLLGVEECQGRPAQLRTDNGLEFISVHLSEWYEKQGLILHWIQPGKTPVASILMAYSAANCSLRASISVTGPRAATRGQIASRLQSPTAAPSLEFHLNQRLNLY